MPFHNESVSDNFVFIILYWSQPLDFQKFFYNTGATYSIWDKTLN